MGFSQQVQYVKEHENVSNVIENNQNVEAVPVDNPEEEVGQRLADFCGELPVYKMVASEEGETSVDARQVSVTYRRCIVFLFCVKCYTTTLTVPTGSNVVFVWFFG